MHGHARSAASAGARPQPRVIGLWPGDPRWESFVDSHPDALPYHHPAWSQVLGVTFGYTPAALGCEDDRGHLSGVLPLFENKSLLAGVHLSSLPHTPVAGPLAADENSLRALLSAATSRVDRSAARWLQLKVPAAGLEMLVEGFSRMTRPPAYVLELPETPDSLCFGSSRNHTRIRWAVREASRVGVVVREAVSLEDLRRWHELYLQTTREQGTPAWPLRIFTIMWEILAPQGRLRLLLAERRAGGRVQLLAGSLFLLHGRTVVCAFSARDRAQLDYRPSDAIHWQAIMAACRAGFRRYDFGEEADGPAGGARKWGADRVERYRYRYPRQREPERGVLAGAALRQPVERARRRLPSPATARLGRIYRRL